MAILILKNLLFVFKEQHNDCEGRYVVILGMLYTQELTLFNIYASNEDCPKCMTDIVTLFSQYNTDFGIVTVDFNCCVNSNLINLLSQYAILMHQRL